MKTVLALIIMLFVCDCVAGQYLHNLNILMEKSDEKQVYLTQINKSEKHFFFTEDGREDILFDYDVRIETEGENDFYISMDKYHVKFIPDTNGLYKIEQMYGGGTSYSQPKNKKKGTLLEWNDNAHGSWFADWIFLGYSNDTTLLPVRILRFYNEQIPEIKVYESDQVDEQPALTLDGLDLNLEEYISDWLKRKWTKEAIKEVSGFVRFTYIVNENGWLSNVVVDHLEIDKKEHISIICSGINYAITEYYYIRDPHYRWRPGKLNGVPVAVREYVTILFNKNKE